MSIVQASVKYKSEVFNLSRLATAGMIGKRRPLRYCPCWARATHKLSALHFRLPRDNVRYGLERQLNSLTLPL